MINSNIKVLFSEEQIAERVAEMGHAITEYFSGSDLTVVALTNGAMPFAADLIRKIDLPVYVDTLAVASYHADRRGDEFDFRSKLKLNPSGRKILLVDEVLDSGRTLKRVKEYLMERGVLEVKTAVMVIKNVPRDETGLDHADWSGFEAPNDYLVGYGLDSNELYRNVPFIGILK